MEKHRKCSFCGRHERDVQMLVTGVSGCICDECARLANEVVEENIRAAKKGGGLDLETLPKPREIKEHLDKYGQVPDKSSFLVKFPDFNSSSNMIL